MALTRRQAVIAALGTLALAGCNATGGASNARPGPPFPRTTGARSHGRSHTVAAPHIAHQHTPAHTPAATPRGLPVNAIARSQWTDARPVAARLNPMNGISKITIHHEGSSTRRFTGYRETANHLKNLQASHVNNNDWGDIGYHFIIDRDGRLWEGRSISKQGAHVSQNNEHNLGVMVLGNFDRQDPTQKQIDALFQTARALKRHYRVRTADVKSHKEIRPTACPGAKLQRHMDALRRYVG